MTNEIIPFKGRILDDSSPVYVYRCLNRTGIVYSILQRSKVVAHTTSLLLREVSFHVRDSGKKKSMAECERNVHAFVKGYISYNYESVIKESFPHIIKYNPFVNAGFINQTSSSEIKLAGMALINYTGLSVII